MSAAEKLAERIVANYDNPLQGSTIDVPAHVESLLQSLGATTCDSGGKVTSPMGRYTGVKEMIEMSKTPGEYKYPLTPFGSW